MNPIDPLNADIGEIVQEQAKGNRVIPTPEHSGVEKVEGPLGLESDDRELPPANDVTAETDERSPEVRETHYGESTSRTGRPLPPE